MSSLPSISSFLASQYRTPNFGEGHAFSRPETHQVGPPDLTLETSFSARAYFISEGPAYRNQLGFNSTGSGGPRSSQPGSPGSLMFADVSTTQPVLSPGSWVDLGVFAANTQLQFFLIAGDVNNPRGIYSTKSYSSALQAAADGVTYDRFQHAIELDNHFAGQNYVFIGFEDLRNGEDWDYNDSIFAIELLPDSGGIAVVPEPGTYVAAGAACFYGLIAFLRRAGRRNSCG